jgi:hypothetical protein
MKELILNGASKVDLPSRAKSRVLTSAKAWEYAKPQMSDAERLAKEMRPRRLTEATLTVERFQSWDTPNYPGDLANLRTAVATRDELLGEDHPESAKARWMLGIYMFARENDIDKARDGVVLMRQALSQYRAAAPLSDITLGMEISLADAALWCGDAPGAEASIRKVLKEVAADIASAKPQLMYTFAPQEAGGNGFSPGFHGRVLLPRTWQLDWPTPLAEKQTHMADWARQILELGVVESALRQSAAIVRHSVRRDDGTLTTFVSGSWGSERLARAYPDDARVHLPAALWVYRDGRVAEALRFLLKSINGCQASLPTSDRRPHPCDRIIQLGLSALIRHRLSTADPATLAAAGEIDMKADPTLKAPLTADEHRQKAREALAKARALMAPAADGTPSKWANDEDAKALLAEAEALLEPREPKP